MTFLNEVSSLKLSAGLVCCFIILFSSSAWAGKLYKWVDKNGQTHYTQVPPPKDQLKHANAIAEKTSANAIPASRKGDYAYCGELKLPGPLYKPKSILLGLNGRIERWKRSLKQSDETMKRQLSELAKRTYSSRRYSSTNNNIAYANRSSDQRKKTARKIKEYRCALAWADRQKSKYSDIKQEMSHDLRGAKTNYQAVLDAAHRDCGFEPKDYASANYNNKKMSWKKCMRPFDRKIRTSERNLRKLQLQSNKMD